MNVLAIFLLLGASAQADFGLSSTTQALAPVTLDDPAAAAAVSFTLDQDMEARALAVHVDHVHLAPSYLLSLHRQSKGRPGELLASAGGVVPAGAGWMLAQLDGLALGRGEELSLVITPDLLRGGAHPVDQPSASRFAAFSMAAVDPAPLKSQAWIKNNKTWIKAPGAPLWAVLGRGKRISGSAWLKDLSLGISPGRSRAQVIHFPCGTKPRALRARLRIQGSPSSPLMLRVYKHDYHAHKVNLLWERPLAQPADLKPEWSWHELPFPADAESFPPDCHYFSLESASGTPEDAGACSDCYQVSGAIVAEGLELAQELSWFGGAHRDRLSTSKDGKHWVDDYAADLDLVLAGDPCAQRALEEAPRLLPTPVPPPSLWPRR